MKVKVVVTLKQGVLDPQGQAIERSLNQMGHREISHVRQGKYFELDVDVSDKDSVRQLTEEVAREVLSNPLIETFEIEEIA